MTGKYKIGDKVIFYVKDVGKIDIPNGIVATIHKIIPKFSYNRFDYVILADVISNPERWVYEEELYPLTELSKILYC